MKNITDYIDTAIARSGSKSKRKFCELLGVSSSWIVATSRGTLPTDETMLRLAEIAGVPPHVALLDLNIWRSKGKAQAVYKRLSQAVEKGAITASILFFTALPFCQIIGNDFIYYGN